MDKFWEFVKERQATFIVIIGVISFALASVGVIPFGDRPWQVIDSSGRIALWISGAILTILGIYLVAKEIPKNETSHTSTTEKHPLIFSKHRATAHNYYEEAFSSGKEVIMLSMMSQTTLKEIEPRLQKAQASGTRIKILTLDPNLSEDVIEAIRLHLDENSQDPKETVRQVKKAWENWSHIASKFSNVQLRKYRSAPTMQGMFIKDSLVTVELLPYATHPLERPKLIISRDTDEELFDLFQEKISKLWQQADE